MLQPSSIEQFYIIKENLIFDSKMIQLDYKMKDLKNIKLDVEDYKTQIFSAIHTIDIEIKLLGGTIESEEFDSISKRKLALLMEQ
jgi:predicted enzyme involved in methoxymalonyl-ACP biosynthesis